MCPYVKSSLILPLQVGKTELHEVAPAHFLVSLGVLPQGQETKKREGQVNGSLFYKLNKYAMLLTCLVKCFTEQPELRCICRQFSCKVKVFSSPSMLEKSYGSRHDPSA